MELTTELSFNADDDATLCCHCGRLLVADFARRSTVHYETFSSNQDAGGAWFFFLVKLLLYLRRDDAKTGSQRGLGY